MPDPATQQRLRGLVLSAFDLKNLVDWPEALIEDYLNIIDNLILLADTLDVETDKNIDAQLFVLPEVISYEKRIRELEYKILTLETPQNYEKRIRELEHKITTLEACQISSCQLVSLERKIVSGLYELPIIKPIISHGSCYGIGIGWSQANAVQNTWYPISDADMADGILHNAEHDGSGKITVYPKGHYFVIWGLSGGNTANDDTTEITISVDGTEIDPGKVVFETDKANAHFSLSGHAVIDCSGNSYIEVSIRTTDNNTPDLTVDNLDIKVILIDQI